MAAIGQILGHYRIESKLGEGGMGVVYRAFDTHLERLVAIKVFRPDAQISPERRRRFVQEAKAASALNHPNIITIYDIDTAEGIDFIAMEYLAGKTLDRLIPRSGMRLSEILKCSVQIAGALTRAHAAGIIHRDIKPANVMVAADGHVKVLDFGLAKLTEQIAGDESAPTIAMDEGPRTEEGTIVGTMAYMSPEQAEGKKLDVRSDIFSFGSILYEMTTGRRPFHGETKMSTLAAILNTDPPAVHDVATDAPRDLEKIISRCLRKDPNRRFQHMDDVKVALEELKEESESGNLETAVPLARLRIKRSPRSAAVALAALIILAGTTWWFTRSPAALPAKAPNLGRLTSDSGLTTDPALSPDGKLLAFASDRSGEGNLDIYVQQVGGGAPIRLTHGPLDNAEPAFSPDDTKIAFRSERDGGGLYIVPSLGGEPRLLAKDGRRPRFSPDGSLIAYWVGEQQFNTGKIYVIPSSGSAPPRQLQDDFAIASYPLWAPDGKHVLFSGRPTETQFNPDWWVTSIDGGPAIRTGAVTALRDRGFTVNVDNSPPGMWDQEDQLIFSYVLGDSTNLWRIPISPKTWKVAGAPQRLTFGTGEETQPAVAGSRIVFASLVSNDDIWSLPVDANRGKTLGEPLRLTHDAATDWWPSVSADGRRVTFISDRTGNWDSWLKDIDSGKESALTTAHTVPYRTPLSRDGSKIAYAVSNPPRRATWYALTIGPGGAPGVPEKICGDCGGAYDWSPDSRKILTFNSQPNPPRSLVLWDLASGERTAVVQHPKDLLAGAQISPDGRWLGFVQTVAPTRRRIFVVPLTGKLPVPQGEWIPITDGLGAEREPRWSPDGKLLYFLSERDGFRCFWAQPIDPATKHPAGTPFAVQHFHRARFSIRYPNTGIVGLGVARDKIVFAMRETTGNIWMVH